MDCISKMMKLIFSGHLSVYENEKYLFFVGDDNYEPPEWHNCKAMKCGKKHIIFKILKEEAIGGANL